MSTEKNNNVLLQKRIELLEKENAELKEALEKKANKGGIDLQAVKDAQIHTGIRQFNVPSDLVQKIIGYDDTKKQNTALGKWIDKFSIKNDKYDMADKDQAKRHFTAKAIAKSGIYNTPDHGVVYASVSRENGQRTFFAIDRMGLAMLAEHLKNVPAEERFVK